MSGRFSRESTRSVPVRFDQREPADDAPAEVASGLAEIRRQRAVDRNRCVQEQAHRPTRQAVPVAKAADAPGHRGVGRVRTGPLPADRETE